MPVPAAAAKVFKESSVPLAQDKSTPNPLYITDTIPNVFANDEPLFITWLINLSQMDLYIVNYNIT